VKVDLLACRMSLLALVVFTADCLLPCESTMAALSLAFLCAAIPYAAAQACTITTVFPSSSSVTTALKSADGGASYTGNLYFIDLAGNSGAARNCFLHKSVSLPGSRSSRYAETADPATRRN